MKPQCKTETLNLRVEPRIKLALREAATKEHRTLANMVEFLIVDYCEKQGIHTDTDQISMPLNKPTLETPKG